jgi:hypothetical protein
MGSAAPEAELDAVGAAAPGPGPRRPVPGGRPVPLDLQRRGVGRGQHGVDVPQVAATVVEGPGSRPLTQVEVQRRQRWRPPRSRRRLPHPRPRPRLEEPTRPVARVPGRIHGRRLWTEEGDGQFMT